MMHHAATHRTSNTSGGVNPLADTRSTSVDWDPHPFSEEWQSKDFTVDRVLVVLAKDFHPISVQRGPLTYDHLVEALRSRLSAPGVHLSTTKLQSDLLSEEPGSHGGFERVLHQTISTTRIEEEYFERALLGFSKRISALIRPLKQGAVPYSEMALDKSKTKSEPLLDKIRAATASVPDEEWNRVPKDLSVNFRNYLYGRKT